MGDGGSYQSGGPNVVCYIGLLASGCLGALVGAELIG